ncbi:fluoride efflux transporter CrcB [Pseudonocardia adelaidensis]|uniref:Fluoride-specific ion channel FluC n=1 Tax=Pseudonocardia adelaidensis TaxID=648754 RepID=A0ABP9NS30_9PSEU
MNDPIGDALVWIGVVLLGGVGSVLRFALDKAVSVRTGRAFPYGTLVVNVSGALVLGFLTGLVLDERTALLAGTALVGSYTTFSTWMFETQRLAEDRQVSRLAGNIVVSLVVGVGAAALGRFVGGAL